MRPRTVTVHATAEQVARWRQIGGTDLDAFLARAADFYIVRLQARQDLAHRLQREGRL